jgi:hypothetical protein
MNVSDLKSFKDERFSMIRDMLDYSKLDKKTMLMSALGQGSAADDEKVVAEIDALRKKQAGEMVSEFEAIQVVVEEKTKDFSSSTDSDEDPIMRRSFKRKVKKIHNENLELALFSKHARYEPNK